MNQNNKEYADFLLKAFKWEKKLSLIAQVVCIVIIPLIAGYILFFAKSQDIIPVLGTMSVTISILGIFLNRTNKMISLIADVLKK